MRLPRRLAVPSARAFFSLLFSLTFAFGGCSVGTDSSGDGGVPLGPDAGMWWTNLRSLSISPSEATLQGSPTTSSTQQFRVTAVFNDGSRRDVTRAVTYDLSPADVGSVREGLFTTSRIAGGEAQLVVRASRTSTVSAIARVVVRWSANAVAPGLPDDLPARFANAGVDPAGAPRLAYPYDNTLFPPNLSNLEVQWTPPAGAGEFYDVAFTNAITDVHLYVRCTPVGSGCGAPLDRTAWQWISQTNRGATEPLQVRVRALLANGRRGESASARVRFAPDAVEGGIYYWTAAGDANGIYRYDFTRGDTAPQAFYTVPDTPRNSAGEEHSCNGCHTLSLDGTRMATVLGGSHVGDVVELDVGRRTVVASKIERWAQLLSFSPDATRLVASRDGEMRMLNAADLNTLAPIATGGYGTHPEWSPTDNGIVFTRAATQTNSIWITGGEIAWLPHRDGNTFGAPEVLVPRAAGENHYYPSVTPDGRYVVYNRSICPGGDMRSGDCDAYDDPSAELWIVDTDASSAAHRPVVLANANAQGPTDTSAQLTNSWPRVSPFTTRVNGRRVYWVTFSSKRNYGVRLVGQNRPQLWMVAIAVPDGEVSAPIDGDPSFAPFWLPFQDIGTGNHIAQWTRTVVAIGGPSLPGGLPAPN